MELTLCLEQALGHKTHGQNLEAAVARGRVAARTIRVEQSPHQRGPWAVAGSRAAYRFLREQAPSGPVLFHTQTIALLAPFAVGTKPYVVSVDATPIQVDEMGRWYRHRAGPRFIESAKRNCYRMVLRRAAAVVAWSGWAARSLVADYGVDERKITIAHPGAPESMFQLRRCGHDGPPRILFVGADFERKGGPQLLQATRKLRLRNEAEVVLVTSQPLPAEAGVRVVNSATPGSPALLNELERADIFCLPTLGDCTPVAIEEAMAAGLPVITTAVGANAETVQHEETGLLVSAGNAEALAGALDRLIFDRTSREQMGEAARARAFAMMHADRNAERVLELLGGLA